MKRPITAAQMRDLAAHLDRAAHDNRQRAAACLRAVNVDGSAFALAADRQAAEAAEWRWRAERLSPAARDADAALTRHAHAAGIALCGALPEREGAP